MKELPQPPCEAPVHEPKCDGIGSTVDHFTPRCIAKALGWSEQQVNDPMNLQNLSEPCHRAKDATTPLKKMQVLFQENGGFIPLGGHV